MTACLAIAVVFLILGSFSSVRAQPPSHPHSTPVEAGQGVKVMIVGDFHMSNPGHDLHNAHVDDMLSPERQSQICGVSTALGRFKPTVVAAEWPAETVSDRYAKFQAGAMPQSDNEVVQLGFRLARESGSRMVGVDVDGDFPYEAVDSFAKAHGQSALLDAAGAQVQDMVQEQERRLAAGGVADVLRYLNDPQRLKSDNGFYRTTLKIGAGTEQPGVLLLTAWYQRTSGSAPIFYRQPIPETGWSSSTALDTPFSSGSASRRHPGISWQSRMISCRDERSTPKMRQQQFLALPQNADLRTPAEEVC